MNEPFVYYDPEYDPSCGCKFIFPNISEKIVDYLKSNNFRVIKADEIKDIMLSVVERKIGKNIAIVFAQDVAPDTILDDISPNALVRQYLDCGGSIIWIGDIPFWSQAKKNGENKENNWWQNGSPANILGVNPVFPSTISRTRITTEGFHLGLKLSWTGIRPILAEKNITPLSTSKCKIGKPYQMMPLNWWERQLNKFRGFNLGAGNIRLGFELKEDNQSPNKDLLWNKTVLNSWFKNYDPLNPHSGFYRIWDYKPAALCNNQLNDLLNITRHCI